MTPLRKVETASRRTVWSWPLCALLMAATGCDRIEVDPSVAARPLPSPGEAIDEDLADAGAALFQRRCVACHRLEGPELVGPNLGDVASRRDYAWVRGMVLAPDSMLRGDDRAKALLERYRVPMADTGLDEARFRAILEFLRREAGAATRGVDSAAEPDS